MNELLNNQTYASGGNVRNARIKVSGTKKPVSKIRKELAGNETAAVAPGRALVAANVAAGTYYTPRTYGEETELYAQRVDAARQAMEKSGKALQESQKALESSRAEVERKKKRYYDLSEQLSGDGAAELLAGIEKDWTEAVNAYGKSRKTYETAWAQYSPFEEAYNKAAGEYNEYVRQEQGAYDQWRATIRSAEDIRTEQQAIKEKRAELQRRMQWANDIAAGTAAPGIQAQAADNEAMIRQLQEYLGAAGERESLLAEELGYSEYFRFEDLRQNGDFGQRSRYDETVGDEDYHWINDTDIYSLRNAQRGERDPYAVKQYMTPDEIAMYNYVYSAEGADGAKAYMDYLKAELEGRRTQENLGRLEKFAGEHPLAASAVAQFISPVAGITSSINQMGSFLAGKPIDIDNNWNLTARQLDVLQQGAGEKIQEAWGPVGSFAYQTGMSALNMLGDALVGGPAAMALIGSRAFSGTVIDAKKRGLSDKQAVELGTISMLAEVLTERLGLDEMLKLPDEWASAGFWKGLLKGAGGEALEEGVTNLANLAADISIAGEKSEFAQNIKAHKEAGKNDRQALWAALGDAGISLGLDMLGGGISGGVYGGFRGWQGKRAAAKTQQKTQQKTEGAADIAAPEKPTGEPVGVADNGTMPADNGTTPADNGTEPVAGGAAQAGSGIVQKRADAPDATQTMNENGGNTNGEGEHVLPGGPERNDAPGTREQAEQYEVRRERQQAEARSQTAAAAQRRVKAENLERLGKAQRVSSQELGLKRGTEVKELLELPRYEWDHDLWDTVTRIEKETGYKVRTVTGNIGIRLKNGMGLAKGYIDRVSGSIVLNVAHSTMTAGQIGDHELWHWKMDGIERLTGKRADMIGVIERQIREEFGDEELDAVLDKYIDGYGDVYDMDAPDFLDRVYEEIIADAYAGINAFGAEADRFRSVVDTVMEESGMGRNVWNASEQEGYAAPGGDQRVYTDEDAPPPRDEDYSQVPEYDWDDWDDSMADFAMDGKPDGTGKEQAQAYITAQFRMAVDQILNMQNTKPDHLIFGYTPDVFTSLGMPSLPFTMGTGHIYSAAKTEVDAKRDGNYRKGTHYHGLGADAIKNIYESLCDPVAIIASKDVNKKTTPMRSTHSIVAIVDIGTGMKSLLLPVEITAERTVNGMRMDVNTLSSVYEKNAAELVNEAIALENTGEIGVYYAKKEATTLPGAGVQFPIQLQRSIASNGIIHKLGDKVNMNIAEATQSQQFKRWFGDWQNHPEKASKVVDADGTPKVVYHGTNSKFYTFDAKSGAYWFSENEDYAEAMMEERGGGRIIAAYLSMKNPYRAVLPPGKFSDPGYETPILREARTNGHDGVIIDCDTTDPLVAETFYVVFDNKQIKSATDNLGTFDGTNPDIRYSVEDGIDDQELVERMAVRMDQTVMDLNAQAVAVHNAKLDAEKREADAKAERKRQSDHRQMERNRERAQQHKEERQRLRREANAVMTDDLQQFGKPQWTKRDTTKRIMDLFDTPAGMKNETKALIEEYLDHILEKGSLEDDDRRTLMTKLIERGVVEIEADEIMAEGRSYLKGNKIYVSDSLRQEFGDDWNSVRKKAFGLGLYLVDDRQQAGVDQWWQDMNGYLPGMFDAEETDQRTMLERLLWIAEEGKAEKLSIAEYTQRLAKQEQVSEADMLDSLAEKLEQELRQFARDADVEMGLRGYTKKNIGERMHRQLTRERLQRAADKAHYRETMQNARNRLELNKLQERTLKTLQWLNKNKYRASEEIQAQIQEVLSDIDLYAVGAANELNWHPKYEMTWRDLAEVYKASKDSPNFIPSAELDRIVARLDNRKIEELDVNALNDLFNAAVGLRKEIFDAEKALSFATDQSFDELYTLMTGEMRTAKKPRKGSIADKFFNINQLTPMNVLRQIGGWRPDGAFAKMAGVLEQGEKEVRAYKVKANRILADWLEENRDWVYKADGQGKDGIWIEVEIPQLEGIGLDGGATFGDTVKVKMTPMQRVHLYLESRNEDNLRHMVGGRTFADPELYSQGKRTEAYAQGITVKMAPETVKALVENMTPEELELAGLLDSYYNGLAHDEINRVSNKLYGYNKAMGKQYAPIFTNQNFTKSEAGIFDQTAEGVGNLKERVKAKNPSYNISALDAFERNVDKTAEFVGMAIPVRDWNSLINWRTKDSSMKDEITHEWGQDRLDYIDKLLVDLQGGTPGEADVMQELGDKLLSNYISSIFGFNPSIVLKQVGSLPLAAAYLGAGNMSFDMFRKERRSREFIAKYTQELQWRGMGYSMPETKQLKDKPGWAQKSGKKWVENIFGGGFITKMDEATASVLWAWAENKVRKEHPRLEIGDQKAIDEGNSPFYKKVAEEFDRAVSHSQSVSDVAHQSTMRRSKGIIARTFTMFRSDSAQTYNALRQMWGEKEYWDGQAKRYADSKTDGGKEKLKEAQAQQQKAAKRIGTVVVATVCNALLAELVDFAMAALKGKLKNYEDEEEERLTALSVLSEIGWGMFESGAGVVVGGDEIAGMLSRFITGEKGYGEEAPGLEQLLDLEDRIATAVEGCKKGDILGAVREVGMAFSTYYAGFPAENMEKFLITGIAKHFAPGLVAGYEDALEAPQKSDLKGMTGAALEVRLGHVMKEYGMELDDEAQAALAKIYEAGYTDAVPSAAPEKVTIDGQERKLGKQAQRQYDKIRSQVVNGELAALIASPFFQEADGKTQAKMLNRLYDFAGEKAKEEVLEGYESDSAALAEYTEIAGAGGSVADCVIFQTETTDMKNYMKADLLREWDTGDAAKELMFRHLISDSQDEEIAELREAGVTFDQFLEVYAMHGQIDAREGVKAAAKATEFAHWLDGQRFNGAQKATIKKEMAYFQFMPAQAERYNTATEAGLDAEDALDLAGKLDDLEPPEGKTTVQEIQKWRVAIDDSWNEESQLQRLKAVGMNDAAYAKCEAAWNEGIAPAAYVRAQEIKEQFDSDGNGSLTNEDWRNLINSLVPSGIALPGDKEHFNLTNEQMGFLWQMLTGSKSTKNNPFSAAGGEKWLAIKNADK